MRPLSILSQGKRSVEGTLPEVGFRVDPCPANRLLPEVEAEAVAPAVEATAETKGRLDQRPDLLAAPGEDPLEEAHPGVMPFDADVPVLQAPPEELLAGG